MIEQEIWVDAPGFEEFYLVSNLGRILRIGPKKDKSIGGIIHPGKTLDGYIRARLYPGGRARSVFVHRLVATAFHGPPPDPKSEVNHKDGNPSNNESSNLEWVTRSENLTHAIRVLGRPVKRGEGHPRSKLSDHAVREIREIYESGRMGQILLARKFNVSQATIWRIVKKVTREYVT